MDRVAALALALGCAGGDAADIARRPCWRTAGRGDGCWYSTTRRRPGIWCRAATRRRCWHVLITTGRRVAGDRGSRWKWTCSPGPNQWPSCTNGWRACQKPRGQPGGRARDLAGDRSGRGLHRRLKNASGGVPAARELLRGTDPRRGAGLSYPGTVAGRSSSALNGWPRHTSPPPRWPDMCIPRVRTLPLSLLTGAADKLPKPLSGSAADPLAWRKMLTTLNQSALAQADEMTVHMHRLTQAILRDQLTQRRPPPPGRRPRRSSRSAIPATRPIPPPGPCGPG